MLRRLLITQGSLRVFRGGFESVRVGGGGVGGRRAVRVGAVRRKEKKEKGMNRMIEVHPFAISPRSPFRPISALHFI